MRLEVGEIITLDTMGKDYIVLKKILYNNTNYAYLMTTAKPTEILVVKLVQSQNGTPLIMNVVDSQELNTIMTIVAQEAN